VEVDLLALVDVVRIEILDFVDIPAGCDRATASGTRSIRIVGLALPTAAVAAATTGETAQAPRCEQFRRGTPVDSWSFEVFGVSVASSTQHVVGMPDCI